jgi:hypothetical protein
MSGAEQVRVFYCKKNLRGWKLSTKIRRKICIKESRLFSWKPGQKQYAAGSKGFSTVKLSGTVMIHLTAVCIFTLYIVLKMDLTMFSFILKRYLLRAGTSTFMFESIFFI